MSFERIKITDLKSASYNPRVISEENFEKLKKSLNQFGLVDPIVINLKNNNTIIGGHQRYNVLLEDDSIDELYLLRLGDIGWVFDNIDLKVDDENVEKLMNINLNQTNLMGEWNNSKLEALFTNLELENIDLDLTGFEDFEIDEISLSNTSTVSGDMFDDFFEEREEYAKGNDLGSATVTVDDLTPTEEEVFEEETEIEEEQISIEDITTDIEKGDLFQLGQHRVMCGDCTDDSEMEILMDGAIADTIFTDPPYDLHDFKYTETIDKHSTDSNIFIMNSDINTVNYLKQSPFSFVEFIIGDFIFNIPRQNRPYLEHIIVSHEIKGDASHYRNINKGMRIIIKMKYRGTLKDDLTVHKHQKSIEFIKIFLEHYGNENILDLFGGSGSTLMACEEIGLKCFVMEIEPKFVQIIIDRYEKATGKEAIKLN